MLEIPVGVARHAELLHYASRRSVARVRVRQNFVEGMRPEAPIQYYRRCLRRYTKAPITTAQAPPHLDTRSERRVEGRNQQAHAPRKFASVSPLYSEPAEPVPIETRIDTVDELCALCRR